MSDENSASTKIFQQNSLVQIGGRDYKISRLLGKGKGGYSYLASCDDNFFVVKQIHHEPCDYYNFGDKIQAELSDYKKLLDAQIRIPKMISFDVEAERLIKEFIDGPTIDSLEKIPQEYFSQVREMAERAKRKNMNIDFYPTNFVAQNGLLYYIDYETNEYSDEWNFENWGKKYWQNAAPL
uniref:Protein kinase domain-containing protein n=1 Tax=uncultured Spirochaetaceae bacterium TaxID=201186 RepID=A0A650EPS2_9SPIO|nr:hypothetical protein Unknown280_1440 [uncultured Spirochaetaceae bacterium]